MRIEPITINVPELRGQIEAPAKVRQEAQSAMSDERTLKSDSNSFITLKEDQRAERKNNDKNITPVNNKFFELKPVFALDEDKNVVIRFLDKEGKTVRQFPPEEYINMMKKLHEVVDNLYSKKV